MMMTRTRTTTNVFTNSRSKRSERIIIKRLRFRRRAKVDEEEGIFDEIPVLSGERFLQLHREKSTPDDDDENCLLAMYSSHVRAITTDSDSFVMKVDDHGFHRGHGFYRRGDENVSRLGLPFGPIENERGDGVSNLPERIGEFGFAGANSERDRVGGV